jgi:hypothetical protein
VADGYAATRLGQVRGLTPGAVAGLDAAGVLARLVPAGYAGPEQGGAP